MKTKKFHLGDVLSITDGRLLSPRHMKGIYDILNWMTGDNLYTHQLPRAMAECRPFLLKQHPQLDGADLGNITPTTFAADIARLVARFGEMLDVEPLPPHAHERIDPLSELAEKVHPNNIVVVRP